MSRVIHFEIGIDNPERAKKFYENVFGWKIDKWGPIDYWLASTGEKSEPGIDGALMRKGSVKEAKNQSIINTISIASLEDSVKKIKDNGGKVLTPKTPIPGIGYFSYCQDTEGNVFGIMEEDKTAK